MKLIVIVTLVHVLLLFCFNLHKESKPTKKNKIIVKTETLKPSLPIVAQKEPKIDSPQVMAKVETIIAPLEPKKELTKTAKKTEIKTKTQAKKEKPAPKKVSTPAKKTADKKQTEKKPADKELLGLMKEGLNKMEKTSSTLQKKSQSSSYQKIGKLESESLETASIELSYAEEIAIYLKHHLHFPDSGTMKIALTLSSKGALVTFTILSSSSPKNETVAQKSLAHISFPPFNDRFKDRTKTFTILVNIEPS